MLEKKSHARSGLKATWLAQGAEVRLEKSCLGSSQALRPNFLFSCPCLRLLNQLLCISACLQLPFRIRERIKGQDKITISKLTNDHYSK